VPAEQHGEVLGLMPGKLNNGRIVRVCAGPCLGPALLCHAWPSGYRLWHLSLPAAGGPVPWFYSSSPTPCLRAGAPGSRHCDLPSPVAAWVSGSPTMTAPSTARRCPFIRDVGCPDPQTPGRPFHPEMLSNHRYARYARYALPDRATPPVRRSRWSAGGVRVLPDLTYHSAWLSSVWPVGRSDPGGPGTSGVAARTLCRRCHITGRS